MKKIYILLLSALFVGCSDELDKFDPEAEGAVELKGINATIETSTSDTRAANDPVYLPEHISRFRFEDGDRMTFTTIKRTEHPLSTFNYVGVEFQCNASGAWDRDKNTGYLDGKLTTEHPQRVYWSDALSQHTFIGYSLPKVVGFDWDNNSGYYSGSIGDKSKTKESETIDYNPQTPETDIIKEKQDNGSTIDKEIKKSSKMRAEDLLLSYATDLVADASVANVKYYHALSSIKVQVSMRAFYGSELDGYTIVEDMKLLNQPTLYKWTVTSAKAEPLDKETHLNNNPKDMKLWDYYPNGNGSGANKTFTFYGITVPQETGYEMQDLVLTFKVKYPDPQKTKLEDIKTAIANGLEWTHWQTKTYKATIAKNKPVYFHPGQCTVINLTLNHMDEELTVGAEYMEWQFVSTPDEGDLHKKTTFLDSTDSNTVKTTKDNVTEDDATWLYYVSENGQQTTTLKDIYGNNGTQQNPFTISTADQLLAFAYEVNNGKTFTNYYVKLDADIYMQPSTSAFSVSWVGIGNSLYTFDGYFIGGGRKISRLKDLPLFTSIGSSATIDNLVLSDTIQVSGTGALANTNAGKIIGCVVDADVTSTSANAGSLVGTNTGTVEACYHIGDMVGTTNVAGLVGQNTGSVIGCYNAGTITGSGTKYGVANTSGSGTEKSCFYNRTLSGNLMGGAGETSLNMQREAFIYDLNSDFSSSSKYCFEYNPAMYPTLIPYVEDNSILKNGFYRVQNFGTNRYVFITDNKGQINSSGSNHDLDAISLQASSDAMYSDPGSIIYVKRIQGNNYNLFSQGTSVNDVINHLTAIGKWGGEHFKVGAYDNGLGQLIGDDGNGKVVTTATGNNILWDAIPVSDTNYFGIKPTVSATTNSDTKYYAPFYASFGFNIPSGIKAYIVSKIEDNKVYLKEVSGKVPNNTPVIVECSSNNASDNKVTLRYDNSSISGNLLKGNMFNNPGIGEELKHKNQTPVTENMRVLGVDNDGNLVFKKPTEETYLPANYSYIIVESSDPGTNPVPESLTVEFEQ